jgi:hypothetical protein
VSVYGITELREKKQFWLADGSAIQNRMDLYLRPYGRVFNMLG